MKNIKNVIIWGFGVTGKSILRFLLSHYLCENIIIIDKKEVFFEGDNSKPNIKYLLEEYFLNNYCDEFYQNFIIIPSPGICIHNEIRKKYNFLSELDLFYKHNTNKIIAITGSVGKTSTVTFIYEILKKYGYSVALGGNIGIPVLDLLDQQVDYIILELSSTQLQYSLSFAPSIVLITNIFPNHLDMHSSFDEYIDAKMHLIKNNPQKIKHIIMPYQVYSIIKNKYHDYLNLCNLSIVVKNNCEGFHLIQNNNNVKKVFYYDLDLYALCHDNISHNNTITKNEILNQYDMPLFSYKENWTLIVALLDYLQLDITKIFNHNDNYEWLKKSMPEHRYEIIKFSHGYCINDSKATIIESVENALELTLKNYLSTNNNFSLILIIGGLGKGIDRSNKIYNFLDKIDYLILWGEEKDMLYDKLVSLSNNNNKNITKIIRSNNKETLIDNINACIKKDNNKSYIVLFSPGGSSFDYFESYQERGAWFKNEIKKIIY